MSPNHILSGNDLSSYNKLHQMTKFSSLSRSLHLDPVTVIAEKRLKIPVGSNSCNWLVARRTTRKLSLNWTPEESVKTATAMP